MVPALHSGNLVFQFLTARHRGSKNVFVRKNFVHIMKFVGTKVVPNLVGTIIVPNLV